MELVLFVILTRRDIVVLVNSVVESVYALRVFVEEGSKLISGLEGVSGLTIVPLLYSPRRYIDARSIDSVYSVLRELGSVKRLGVVLFSGGGDIDEAYLLATYLQGLAEEKLVFYVPRYAKSAATLLALSGDEVVMLPVAELGPIDPLIYDSKADRYIPLQSILEILNLLSRSDMPSNLVNTILEKMPVTQLGDYKRAVEHNAELCARVLSRRMLRDNPEKAGEIAAKLVGYKQHSAAITLRDALELGIKARAASREETEYLWSLHRLWVEQVIDYEELIPPGGSEPVEFKFTRGLVLTVAPRELLEKATSTQSK
jgi:hypothetical protein